MSGSVSVGESVDVTGAAKGWVTWMQPLGQDTTSRFQSHGGRIAVQNQRDEDHPTPKGTDPPSSPSFASLRDTPPPPHTHTTEGSGEISEAR